MSKTKLAAVFGILAGLGVDLSQGKEIKLPKEPDFGYNPRDFFVRPERRKDHPLNPGTHKSKKKKRRK